jgi:adenylosuccinate lyase
MQLVKSGANRQTMHETLRDVSMRAVAEMEAGQPNPLVQLLASDERLLPFLTPEAIRDALDAQNYVGDAPERALNLARRVREALATASET